MTNQLLVDVAIGYVKKFSAMAPPKRNGRATTNREKLSHVLWMCTQIPAQLADDNVEKCHLFLGFAQGVLWDLRLETIDTIRRHNTGDLKAEVNACLVCAGRGEISYDIDRGPTFETVTYKCELCDNGVQK